jgi:putative radical SAM enzyme (TIGR03279 family)
MKHEIANILPESIAHELGITSGDFLLRVNEKEIADILDYRFAICDEEILLEIEKAAQSPSKRGEIWELEIEKDADEDLGLIFKRPLLSAKRRCKNKCVFCFIDQQPRGLRSSLYVKDDDIRLSFLHGNYVTLTNLSHEEIHRIANFHLSPLRISVHTADLDLRAKMMNRDSSNLFYALDTFGSAGIKMHFQIVLCKNLNDGENLDFTIEKLAAQRGAESLVIVPAGITRHRDGLHPLTPFTAHDAEKIISQIEFHQKKCRRQKGKTFVFAADEWYIMAQKSLPAYENYEDFPQLDNGVGMLRLFENEFLNAKTQTHFSESKIEIGIITGKAAENFMRGLTDDFQKKFPQAKISVYAIQNNFFGENITVSGLLTGKDIISQMQNKKADVFFLPENAFRANSETMLDGVTRKRLSEKLNAQVLIGSCNGGIFFEQLIEVLGASPRTPQGDKCPLDP